MKQNSSIVFHLTTNFLKLRYRHAIYAALAATVFFVIPASPAEPSKPVSAFDAAKGFKPAQRDLTEIFLQIAGSLEIYGSPSPYFLHVQSERKRVAAKLGADAANFSPIYFTEDYVGKYSANWNLLAPRLGFDPLAKDIGKLMKDAIKGTRGTGTIIVSVLNEHQRLVFNRLAGKSNAPSSFETLRSKLFRELELGNGDVDEEQYEIPRRDALSYAFIIRSELEKLSAKVDRALNPADAAKVKAFIFGTLTDIGNAAQLELETSIAEWAYDTRRLEKQLPPRNASATRP